ncbi:MAG: N-acetylmuramoyl-L-alanine amidase [Pseudomonadota bacterium]
MRVAVMSYRTLLLLVLMVPALMLGGAKALGERIPVPEIGRDYVKRFALSAGMPALELPPVEGPSDDSRPLIVIDAGHGGRDPGAVGNGIREKDVVLAIALLVRDLLLEQGTIRVAMTRADDRIVTLSERPEIARRLDADLFLSIHADSAGTREDVSGASIYTLSQEASSEAAARFAARENSADRLNGVMIEDTDNDVSAILVELSQGRTQEEATEFARLIEREGQDRIAFHPQAQRSAALAVLRAPDVPGVLFESGFVTNRGDRALLTTPEGRAQYAQVLARAIRVYFARRADVSAPPSAESGDAMKPALAQIRR